MSRWRLTPILLLLLAENPVRAEVLTLREVERRALASDATRGAEAKIAQTDADLEAARSGRRPVVSLSTEASVAPGGQLVEVETLDGQRLLVQGSHPLGEAGAFVPLPRYAGVVSMQANVFDFGRTASRIRAGEHRALAARTEERAQREDLARSTRQAYLAWTVAYARVALAERHQDDGRKRAEAVAGGIAEGGRPSADLNAARQEEVALELEVAEARAGLEHARIALEQLVGETWSDAVVPDLGLLDASAMSAATDAALASSALEQQADAAASVADSFAHEHAPFISTSAEAGLRGQASSAFPVYRVGITLTVPLWDGGLAGAQARSARAQAAALRAEADATRKAREDELRLAHSDLVRAEERLRLAERLRRLAQEQLGQVGEQHRLGAVDLRAVLDAREHAWHAEAQELAAKADRTAAWLRSQP